MSRRPFSYRSPLKYPVYVYAHQIALLVGWRTERVERLWRKHGIDKIVNGYMVTTPSQLQMLWPEQWEACLDRLEEGKLNPPKDLEKQARKRIFRVKKATE